MKGCQENAHYIELWKGFTDSQVFGHVHSYDLYRNWLEAVWLFCDAVNNREAFRQSVDRYTWEQGAEFGRLFASYTLAVEDMPFQDILGELFMELDVNSARSGQYFSPWSVAEFMARMNFDKESFLATVKEKGEFTVCDPAVGSGVLLLSYAKVVNDALGRWGLNKLKLYGCDIDPRCVAMCRIQLRLNGLDAFGRMASLLHGTVPHEMPRDTISPPALPETETIEADTVLVPAVPTFETEPEPETRKQEPVMPAGVEQLVLF